jgi:predicted ATPase/DNA-binding SARP family transcriptional activator
MSNAIAETPSTAPSADHEPGFAVQFFGAMAVRCNGEPLPKMRSRREQWLLALLVLRASNAPVERLWLAGTLWPNADDDAALANLRRSLRFLRDALGPEAARITAPTPRTLQIDLGDAAAVCDATEFDHSIRRGDEASLARAVDLYRGTLLLGCLEEWVVPEREAREQAVIGALERLADLSEARSDHRSAAGQFGRVLDLDPLRETAVRGLMTALAAHGRHAAAAQAYRLFRQRLHRDLHTVDPDPETVHLHRRILLEGRRLASTVTIPNVPMAADAEPGPASASPLASAGSSDASPAAEREPEEPAERPSRLDEAAERWSTVPTPITALIGRESDCDRVAERVSGGHRLVTITGPGGIGKTRLALAIAAVFEAGESFPDGVHFFRLAPLIVPDALAPTLTGALLGSRAAGAMKAAASQGSAEAPLLHFLRDKRMLLVWDNCEHLLAETARLAMALLEACPGVHLLITSRQSLRQPGEVIVPLKPLGQRQAAELFAQRATAASGEWFAVAPEDGAVRRICRAVEGLPLALEMAASWSRALSPADIAARLEDELRLLLPRDSAGRPRRESGSRRRTLEDVFEGSFRLLEPDEAALLRNLVAFSGGWTLRDAARLSGEDELITLDILARLTDKSLVHREQPPTDGPNGLESRYDMLEMVAQCTRDRARREMGQSVLDATRRRHRDIFLEFAEKARPHLDGGPEQMLWLNRLDTDHNNIRAAMLCCSDQIARGEPEGAAKGLRIVAAVAEFYVLRGLFHAGGRWLETMIAAGRPADPAFPIACTEASRFAALRGDISTARRYGDAALQAFVEQGNLTGQASALFPLGYIELMVGNTDDSVALFEKALALQQQGRDPFGEARTREMLAYIARESGRLPASQEHLGEAIRLYRLIRNERFEASAMAGLARQLQGQGDLDSARDYVNRCLRIHRALGDCSGEASDLSALADNERLSGNLSGARVLFEQALRIYEEIGGMEAIVCNLCGLAGVLYMQGDMHVATATAERALSAIHQWGFFLQEPHAYLTLCYIARDRGQFALALEHGQTTLRLATNLGRTPLQIDALEVIATVYWANGSILPAVRLFAAAAAERVRVGMLDSRDGPLPGRNAAEDDRPHEWHEGMTTPFADVVRSILDSGSAAVSR